MRITLIEDNASLAKGIRYRLEDIGHAVDVLSDGDQAQDHLRSDRADLVILDINLPGTDGLTLLRQMRARQDLRPVILLTARTTTDERVRGLDAGADDYLVKPFQMAELEARIRALFRRPAQQAPQTRAIGSLTYSISARQLSVGDEEIELPRREMAVFECLLLAEGRTVPKEAILDHAYGVGADVEQSVVEVYISRLRSRLKPYDITIKAQRGLGYRMTGPTTGQATESPTGPVVP